MLLDVPLDHPLFMLMSGGVGVMEGNFRPLVLPPEYTRAVGEKK